MSLQGSGGVMMLIQNIIDESHEAEMDAISGEAESQAGHAPLPHSPSVRAQRKAGELVLRPWHRLGGQLRVTQSGCQSRGQPLFPTHFGTESP